MRDEDAGCAEEKLSAWLDNELEPTEKRELALHVTACDGCALSLGQLLAARTCVAVPAAAPAKVPPAFWRGVRRRMDEVDRLVRATDLLPHRRQPLLSRHLALAAAAIAILALGARTYVVSHEQVPRMTSLHLAASGMPGDPGLTQAVGFRPDDQWQPVSNTVVNINGVWALQSTYLVGGLPVSVFRLPQGTLDPSHLAPVAVGNQVIYLASQRTSSLAARRNSLGWDVVVSRSTPRHTIDLCLTCPPDERLLRGESPFSSNY
jgi:hypothetical protein